MSTLPRLQLFGVPTIEHDGQRHALACERRSQLLVLLALRRGWVGRAEVAAMLWPEQDGKLAATNLRKTLFRLPMLPWGALVQVQAGALRVEAETDVAAFEAALQESRAADAIALRSDVLLAGFDDDANEAWTRWLHYERERLHAAWRGAALEWLAGEVPAAAAVALSARLLEADPLDEAALRAHLAALVRSGQAQSARQVHARFVERLVAELGIAPGAELLALGATLGASSAPPAAPVTVPVVRGAASGDEGFVGRGAELRRIASLLEQDDCRLLCLIGPGGIGKTRLARRALQELAPGFADGVHFVALEDAADADGFAEKLVRELGAPGSNRRDALADAVAALVARRTLIALDNFEDLAPQAAALLAPLLDGCPGLKLIVTSRVRLAVAGEWTLPVEGLPCPDPEDLDRFDSFDAVRLFVRAARRVQPEWAPASEAAAVVDICRQVEGLPLAIELAAAWVRVLSCAEIVAELRAGIELLHARDPAQPPRHASIEQVFEQSWQRLAPAERDGLARLAVFRGGFTPQAARAVAQVLLPVLGALSDKSLLRKDGARLRLHPLVQQLAAARLPEAQRRANADAHAAHALHGVLALRGAVSLGDRLALQQIDVEIENVRAAWEHVATQGAATSDDPAGRRQARQLADAAQTLMSYCDHRGLRREGLRLGRWALRSPATAAHPALRAVLLAACAHLAYRLDRVDEALAAANDTLVVLDALGDDAEIAPRLLALRVQAGCALRQGRFADANRHYREALALALASEGGDPREVPVLLGNLALVEKRLGHYEEARRLGLESLQAYRRHGDVANEALSLCNLGTLETDMRELDAAVDHLEEALVLCERHGLRGTRGLVLGNLCELHEITGDLAAARRRGEQAMAQLEENGERVAAAEIGLALAAVQVRAGDAAGARAHLAVSLRAALAGGYAVLLLQGTIVFGGLAALVGEGRVAAAVLQFAIAHPRATPALQRWGREKRAAFGVQELEDVPPWPDLPLEVLVQRIVDEAAREHAPLLALLRG